MSEENINITDRSNIFSHN